MLAEDDAYTVISEAYAEEIHAPKKEFVRLTGDGHSSFLHSR